MKYNIILVFIVLSTFISCICLSSSVVNESIYLVGFFYDYTFPSLIPLLISLFILIDTGVLYYLAYILQYVTIPLFKLNGYGALGILLSILTGFPFSTIFIVNLYKKNKITKKEAYVLICSFTLPSFSFIFATIRRELTDHNFLILFISLYLSAFILLFLLSHLLIKETHYITFKEIHNITKENMKSFSLSRSLRNNILSIVDSLTVILGTMIYFSIVSILINNFIPISNTIEGFIEFSFASIKEAKENNILPIIQILSFSSLSCIFQCSTILDEHKLKTYPLILSKIGMLCLSTLIFYSIF